MFEYKLVQYSSPEPHGSNETSNVSTRQPSGKIESIFNFGRFKINIKFWNQILEMFFLQLGFDYGAHKHEYFKYLGVNIVEDLKLLEEDDWGVIIDKRVFGT